MDLLNSMIWPTKKILDCLEKFPKKLGIPLTNYQKIGNFPIIDQGKDFIGGYTDNSSLVYADNLPVIIFGDHTRAIKFIDFPFAVGADGTKVLKPKVFLDPRYFYFALMSLNIETRGYARHFRILKEKEILLPPVGEQKKIVKKIEGLFGEIDKAQKLRGEASEAAKNLFPAELHKIFTEGKRKYKIEELGNIAVLVRGPFGGSLRKDIFVTFGDCVYEQGNVIDNDLKKFRYFITPKKFEEMKRFVVSAGDILMSCSGTIGKFVIIPKKFKKGIINQALLKITPKNETSSDFLKYALEEYLSSSNTHFKGMAIKNIAAVKELKKIKIPLPLFAEQKKIVARLDALAEKVRKLRKLQSETAEDFTALKKSILHRAFTGQLVK